MDFVQNIHAEDFIKSLEPKSVKLAIVDPPYYKIVKSKWDHQWKSKEEYVQWMTDLFIKLKPALADDASILIFGGIGKHKLHPFFNLIESLEDHFQFRNIITWKKRRAYGKDNDYLFCREELAWLSVSSKPKEIVFNVPYLDELRGYAGFSKKYPAKSIYKRVSNVWADITELFKTRRECEKPVKLLERAILTHTNENDLVVDFFTGVGPSAVASLKNNRRFMGAELDPSAAVIANERCQEFVKTD